MNQESSNQTVSGRDVFVSYASQDAAVANSIVEHLESQGLKCWVAPRDVKPGAQYADAIVRAINEAKAVVLVMSASAVVSAHVAREVERAASKRKPIIPFRTDTSALNPELEYFLSNSQWIDVPKLGMPAALTKLQEAVGRGGAISAQIVAPRHRSGVGKGVAIAAAIVIVMGGAVAVGLYSWKLNQINAQAPAPAAQSAPATAFAPPPHSIAVLPFADMSEKHDQEYFSDGLTEELLNSLAEINELQVAARTSSFYFKGKDVDLGTVAHKLNVGAVLEGSVRRSGNTVRITTQLINAVTGFHLWSHTYDRNLGDVLKLETEIADAVASALKVSLLGDVAMKIELGGTHNPAAFDAYLRASKAFNTYHDRKDLETANAGYTEAIRLDPDYAKAVVARFWTFRERAIGWNTAGAEEYETYGKMQADAHQAIKLAPELGEAHLAMGVALAWVLEFRRASEEYERAMTLAPGSAQVLQDYGLFAVLMGRKDAGIAAARRAVSLDPQNRNTHHLLALVFDAVGQYQDEIAALHDAKILDPNDAPTFESQPYYKVGNYQSAREICERKPERWDNQYGLALIYDKLGRHTDAEGELTKLKAALGDSAAYQYAEIYAQWSNAPKALEWLETALRLRDPGLEYLKTDPLLDPIRREPRFQAIERELKFPD